MPDFPIIDSHVHLLDIKRFGYSWAAGMPALQRDFTLEDLMASAAPARIEAFVFAEADVDVPQYMDEARWIDSLSRIDTRLKGAHCLVEKRDSMDFFPSSTYVRKGSTKIAR